MKELIRKVLNEEENVVHKREAEIFNEAVNGEVSELKIWFWIYNVARQQTVRSNFISHLYNEFNRHEIKLL